MNKHTQWTEELAAQFERPFDTLIFILESDEKEDVQLEMSDVRARHEGGMRTIHITLREEET